MDLYCGAGGLSLGLEQAGFDITLAVDRDPHHVATHRRNFPYSTVLCEPAEQLVGHDLLKTAGTRQIDLVCGGPPCQGVSCMGKRYSADPRNTLMDEFARLVLEIRPAAVIMETVPGAQMGDAVPVLERVLRRLGEHYQLASSVRALNAADFGVPQRRERLFVIGIKTDLDVVPRYPDPADISARPTVWDAICDLPALQERDDLFHGDYAKYNDLPLASLHRYTQRARAMAATDYSYPRKPQDPAGCSGCRRVRHRPDVAALYAATAPGGIVPAHNLPRLHPDGVCPTLRAGTDSEHGSYNAPRPVHPVEPRCITVREAARLHGYPDWFKFHPRKWHAHRQIGNSVCPPVARSLGLMLIDQLGLDNRGPVAPLRLVDGFSLPSGGYTYQPRVRQLDEWPKVLRALLSQVGVAGQSRARGATFTVSDVRRAYEVSQATMPRTPPDRFLEDIARSRNRRSILGEVLKLGLSIRVVANGSVYGQFVPKGTPGSIEGRDFIGVSSVEIANATRVSASQKVTSAAEGLLDYLGCEVVVDALFGGGEVTVASTPCNGTVRRARKTGRFEVVGADVHHTKGIVVHGSGGNLPTLASVARLMVEADATSAIVMGRITTRHVVAVVLEWRTRQLEELGEVRRGVFDVSGCEI